MRLYDLLLHLYPTAFRMEYGDDMRRIFAARRICGSGPSFLLRLWVEEFFDILWNAFLVHQDILRQDLRYSLRSLSHARGFALTVVVIIALGIGANTAVFSIVDHALIRQLPYSDSDRIVRLWQTSPAYGRLETSPANFRDWEGLSTSFVTMGAYWIREMNLGGTGDPLRLTGAEVTSSFFPVLGVQPAEGRWFEPEDDRDGAPGTVLISNELWHSRFQGSTHALGQKIRLDGESYTLIGVLPASFRFPSRDTQFWIPFRFQADDFEDRSEEYLYGFAKLKSGVSIDQARTEMAAIADTLERKYPQTNTGAGIRVETLRAAVPKQSRLLLVILVGASVCVLLIACANLANLLVVRVMGRAKELAVRAALGAGRERLIRQLLTEILLLDAAGGLLGLIVAFGVAPLLAILVPTFLPIGQAGTMNIRVFAFAAILALLTGLGFGIIPAMRICRRIDAGCLHENSRSENGDRRKRYRSVLVASEVTASIILLVSSGLLIRALWRIQAIDPGFSAESVFTVQTALPFPKYVSADKRASFYSSVLSGIRELPGVSSAAYISFLPMVMSGGIWQVGIVPGVTPDPVNSPRASLRFVTPDFFKTLEIPIHPGRDISESDSLSSPHVAVVSQSFVDRFWPGKNPIGQTFVIAFHDRTVVGVVGDVRVRGLERISEPQVYLPHRQVAGGWLLDYVPKFLVVKSSQKADDLMGAVRTFVQKADAEVPVSDARSLRDIVDSDTATRRTQIGVLCAFAGLSLLLAGIGIHGLLAFAVSQRAREIGVRIALGATTKDILKMVLRQGLRAVMVGGAAGIILAYTAGRSMQSLLAGISPGDLAAFTMACALAILATLSGCLAPALRAVQMDPVAVMRTE